jgi:hypothetical protein
MDRICQYSTIIFAGNVSVLLIVAISTDYWEYRGFHLASIEPVLKMSNRTRLIYPADTDSYVLVRYLRDADADRGTLHPHSANLTIYQPPGLLRKYYREYEVRKRVTYVSGGNNVTVERVERIRHRSQDVLALFLQYGNLFRDCDNLEGKIPIF